MMLLILLMSVSPSYYQIFRNLSKMMIKDASDYSSSAREVGLVKDFAVIGAKSPDFLKNSKQK